MTVLSQKGTDKVIRSPDLSDILSIDIYIFHLGSVYLYGMPIEPFDFDSYALQRLHHDISVSYIGNILDSNCLIRHDRCGYDGKGSIFGSPDNDLPPQRVAAVYYIMILIRFRTHIL